MQEDGSWKCKHGDEECAGDLQQLCVQQYSKDYNRYNWLMNFILCNNKEGLDQTGSFATATKCLKVRHHGYLSLARPGGGVDCWLVHVPLCVQQQGGATLGQLPQSA
jgi:hypothetical protein